jgi:hypothetical protein
MPSRDEKSRQEYLELKQKKEEAKKLSKEIKELEETNKGRS